MDDRSQVLTFEQIHWRSFLQVKSRKKAETVLHCISDALGTPIEIQQCEQYWKDETLYETAFLTSLKMKDVAHATFTTLCIAQKLARHWTISGPFAYADNQWEFSGYVTQTRIPGVMFTTFSINNLVDA